MRMSASGPCPRSMKWSCQNNNKTPLTGLKPSAALLFMQGCERSGSGLDFAVLFSLLVSLEGVDHDVQAQNDQ